jgi:hypothetical protein
MNRFIINGVLFSERGFFPGRKADHLPSSSAEVNIGGAIPPLPHVFMA